MWLNSRLTLEENAPTARTEVASLEQPLVRPVMPELDTTRGVAILLVFWFHAFEFFTPNGAPLVERLFLAAAGQGWSGVNVFFVISGFLITGILLDSSKKNDYYSRFYYRRVLRILPAYYLLLVGLLFIGRLNLMQRHISFAFVSLSFIYLSNITPLLGIPMQYGPLWSLAVEEHFYILWPTAVRTLTRRNLTITAISICLIEPLLRLYAVYRGGLWWGPYTWVSADGLALGALLAIFGRSSHASRRNLLRLVILAAVAASIAMAASVVTPRFVAVAIRGTCVNYFAFGTVGLILWLGTGPHSGLVRWRTLSFYGYISYGLYLIHALCIDLYNGAVNEFFPNFSVGTSFAKCCFRFALTVAVSTGIAYLSRSVFEEFFLQLKDKRKKRSGEPIRTPALGD